ncbi:hypothetical protein NQZ68_039784 [Dissostichus eleginoides]|nr:hypothetical protein NQZ68_039784 [Dissostichus eleginoides]
MARIKSFSRTQICAGQALQTGALLTLRRHGAASSVTETLEGTLCSYRDSVARDPPTLRCDRPMGGDLSSAFAFSYSRRLHRQPSRAERSRSVPGTQGEQVQQQIPPSSDRAQATAPSAEESSGSF